MTIAAATLRFAGLSRLLPVHPEPDASQVQMYRELAGDSVPDLELYFGIYSTLLPHALALAMDGEGLSPASMDAGLDAHLQAAARPYVHVRASAALLACLLVPLTFLLSRRWLADRWALVAAAFIAVSLLHLAHSTVAKAHAAHASLAWLAILCALRQIERATLARCAATAAAAAAAIGMFHTGFFTLLPLGAAALLTRPQGAVRRRSTRLAAWAAPVLACAVGLLFTPGGVALGSDGVQLGHGHSIAFSWLDGRGLGLWTSFLWEHDPALSALALAGLPVFALGLRRILREPDWRRDACVVGAYALPYTLLISLDGEVRDRYVLPLLPLLAVAAALGLRTFVGSSRATVWVGLASALALAFPSWVAVRRLGLERSPSTFDRAATWLQAEARDGRLELHLSPSLALPLFPEDAALAAQLATSSGRGQPWFAYLGRLPSVPRTDECYDLRPLSPQLFAHDGQEGPAGIAERLDRDGPHLVVLEVSQRMTHVQGFAALRALLSERGALAIRISGEDGRHADQAGLDYQCARHPARRLLSATALGPDIEIYRWPGP